MTKLETSASQAGPTFSNAPMDFSDLWGIAKRAIPYVVIGSALGLAGALWLLSHFPPKYKASTQLVLEHSVVDYLQSNRVTEGPSLGNDRYSQNFIIGSEDIVIPVIRKLNLVQDAEFGCANAAEHTTATGNSTSFPRNVLVEVRQFVAWIKSLAGLRAPASHENTCDEYATYGALINNLGVWWDSHPLVISVSFESKDPAKAALISNAVAESYIDSRRDAKRNAASLTAESMRDRLADAKAQAADAERQLIEYKLKSGIVVAGPKFRTLDLSDQMAKARLAMLDAQIRMNVARQTEDGHNIPDNQRIVELRHQYLEMGAKANELESRVGKDHAATIKIRNRMAQISAAIAAERQRIASSYEVDYEFAKARFDELASSLTEAQNEGPTRGSDDARLFELEGAANTLRQNYISILQHVSGEASRLENGAMVLPEARILRRAAEPTQPEPSKKRYLVLAGGMLLGFALGAALTLARHNPIGVFRTTDQAKTSLGLISVIIPKVKVQRPAEITDYALDLPHSRFASSLRVIWSLINAAQRGNGSKVIGVVTALAGEGKTTIAANIAHQMSAEAGERILLIDADFHHRSLTQALAPQAQQGLREALENPERLEDCIVRLERSGADVLPCPLTGRVPNAAQLVGSKQMEELIRRARTSYDLVIIEPPPLALVADARLLAPLCDGFIFVIEWGKTSQRVVLETFTEFHNLWERVLCVVLNKAQRNALRSIEDYKGSGYGAYFDDGPMYPAHLDSQGSSPSATTKRIPGPTPSAGTGSEA